MSNKVDRIPKEGHIILPNGCALYWKPCEVGGREYYSDEIPCGVNVWNTALINEDTLLAAILQEKHIQANERYFEIIDNKE
jgi:hypothetical protein